MAARSSPNGGGPSAPFRIPVGVGGKETAPPDLQPDSFGCVPLRFVFGGLLYSLTQIRPSPLLNQAIKAAAPVLRDHVTLAPVHDATIDEAVAALARRLFDRSRCGAWVRCPSKFVRLAGGGERIRTCMGLFLSSSSFWFFVGSLFGAGKPFFVPSLRSGSRSGQKGVKGPKR